MSSIIVLLESVPDPYTLKVSRLNSSVTETEARKLDERDRAVVEVASRIAGAKGLTVCHPDDVSSMRYPLAKGMDDVIAITGEEVRSSNKLMIAMAIASFVKEQNCTRVLGRSGMLPCLLGALLNYDVVESNGEDLTEEKRIYLLNSVVKVKPPSAIHIMKAAGKKVESIGLKLPEEGKIKELIVLSRELL